MNLILQIVILGILGMAVYARLRHSTVKHAALMGSAIGLHTVAIGAIMVPSLLSLGTLLSKLMTSFAWLTIVHATLGSIVEILGIWLVATWLSNTKNVEKCFKRKNFMRVTIALWLTELILGIFVYMMLYLPA
ncbi:MAG: hypothetical protein ABSB89_00650 [Candidatus Bathyarchaeia archaeon]